jgi:hypothetical protein
MAFRSHRAFCVAVSLFVSAAQVISPDKANAALVTKRADAKKIIFDIVELRRKGSPAMFNGGPAIRVQALLGGQTKADTKVKQRGRGQGDNAWPHQAGKEHARPR